MDYTIMKYKFFPHTADAKFQAYGRTLEEAFANAALALTEIITDPEKVEPLIKKRIEVESEDEKALLYDFLEQFLVLLDSESFLLNSVKSIKIEGNGQFRLKAEVTGDEALEKYEIEKAVKAVTYQEMEIKKEKGKVTVQVVADI